MGDGGDAAILLLLAGLAPTSGKGGKLGGAISVAPTSKMIHLLTDLHASKQKNGWVLARILATQRGRKPNKDKTHMYLSTKRLQRKAFISKPLALRLMKGV